MRTAAALAVLFVLSAAVFWKLTVSSRYTWLENPDQALQVRPWLDYQARELHAGRIPLWDPYEWGGQSLIGQVQPGLANPLNWPLFAMPLRDGHIPVPVLHWYWVLIHWVAAAFAYWFCRDLGAGRAAAVAGGAIYAFTGFLGHSGTPQFLMSAVWLPLIFLFLARTWRGQRPIASAALCGAALGLAFLSGHHNIPIYTAVVVTAAMAVPRSRWAAVPAFLALVLLTSAVQLAPALEYGRQAVRWAGVPQPLHWSEPVPYSVHREYSIGAAAIPGLAVPGLGRHAEPFVGIVVLALAWAAIRIGWKDSDVRLLALLAAAGLVLALGQDTPVHWILYRFVPMVEKARYPAMAVALAQAALAGLAARALSLPGGTLRKVLQLPLAVCGLAGAAVYGFLHFRHLIPADHPAWLFAAAALAFAAALRWPAATAPAAIAVVVLQALVYPSPILRPRDVPGSYAALISAQSDLAGFLHRQPGWFRVDFDEDAVPYNFGDWHGIEQFGSFTASMPDRTFNHMFRRDLFGVRYRVATTPPQAGQEPLFRSASGINVYLDSRIADPLEAVHTGDCPGEDRLRLLHRDPERSVVEADLACAGLVVVGDPYYRGWRASLDGKRVPIQEFEGVVRAVAAGPGRHIVEFQYRPASVYVGAALTLIGLALAGILAARYGVKPHTDSV
jgi:Bacterial membrane protein YfhO